MKYAEYQIENNRVEIFNSILGNEKIVLNGEIVSEKHSIFGAIHFVKIANESYTVRLAIDPTKLAGISFRIYKNGSVLQLKNRLSKRMKNWLALRYILSIPIGLYIGFKAGSVLVYLLTIFNI